MAENSGKNLAQVQFAKLQRANDAKQAMADYEAETVALRAKTAQLRALRLAREAELAAAGEAAAPAPAAKKPKAARKPKGANGANGTKGAPVDRIDAAEVVGADN